MDLDTKLKNYLKKNKIDYIIHEHPAVFTVEESNKTINLPCMHTKNLFLKGGSGKFYLVCLKADKRVNMKKLKIKLNEKELHFASPEELKKEIGLTPGSVSIFGLINSNKIYLLVDEDIWNAESVGFHPNINTATIELTKAGFRAFFNSLENKKEIIKL